MRRPVEGVAAVVILAVGVALLVVAIGLRVD